MSDRFSLLFVCSGNRFRSPLAAALVHRLTVGLPVDIASAGTLEVEGAPSLPEADAAAAWFSVDLSGHRSRRLTSAQTTGTDLVLGFEQTHVRFAVIDAAADRRRTFTLGELVRLLRDVGEPAAGETLVARARSRVVAAHRTRAETPHRREADDLADPFGRRRKVYRRTAAEIQRLSQELAVRLFEIDPATGHALLGGAEPY